MCVIQVDTSAANSTSEGLMWLRLVQSARDKEEQNLEAYVKNGQLFYRSLRRIEKDEELLVWYGKDLIDLLLLSSSRAPAKSKGDTAERSLFSAALLPKMHLTVRKVWDAALTKSDTFTEFLKMIY